MVGILRTVDQPQNAVKFKRNQNEEALKLKSEIEARMKNQSSKSDLSSLKELKSLLDEGIITQEEFDLKKKQILNI
ncbi:hypothetical protein ABW02_12660 [Niallia circulans]|uniref:SHOCT domain-containing protein n=2 Tax=Niallia circulans TaxID=1397 RepID=A0A0J1IK11_NIACI|nr:hypothetical protein ABW02_12660 [Niallia circulans]